MASAPQTVICVPGQWRDRSDIVTSIVSRSGGYLFAGVVLMNVETKDAFSLEVCEHDANLKNAFAIAGRGRLTAHDLAQIDAHSFAVYLVRDGGSLEVATKLMHAAHALIKSGGIAVKIQSTGTAHRADQWTGYCAQAHVVNLLRAYVTYIGRTGHFYSCGMHNLGYPDATVDADVQPNEAANLLHTLLTYLLAENPELHDGETFSIDADAPRYRLHHEPCTMYAPDDLFHNPFGMWKLRPA